MTDIVFVYILFASMLFFTVGSMLGLTIEENSAGMIYKIYCVFSFSLFVIFYAHNYINKSISKKHIITLLILFVYITSGLVAGYSNDKSWLSLVAYCLPASGIAIYYAENRNIHQMVKWIDIIMPLLAVSMLFSVKKLYSDIVSGDAYYSQDLSYYAAYCFILYLFLILLGNNYKRFKFFKGKFYRFFSCLMLPYFLLIQLSAGGRGAFGTLIAGVIIIVYMYNKKKKIQKARVFLFSLIFGGIVILITSLFSSDTADIFGGNLERVFSFFSSEKDLYERTSGRDEVFIAAVNMIKESPVWGYGLFGYKNPPYAFSSLGYPHNIFLEILLQGGILFLIIFLFGLFHFTLKLLRILKDSNQSLIALFVVFGMTLLLYSGSYMESAFFWFSFAYIYNTRVTRIKIINRYEQKSIASDNHVS